MTTVMRSKAVIGGVLIGLVVLVLTAGTLIAQAPTAAPNGTAMAGDPQMAGQMERMREQCTQMMEMMSMMMGGNMSGMMGDQGMQGMEGIQATPMPKR